jgi:thioredoxin reductase (NADPH)
MVMANKRYDVIILGAGPSGLAAALYCARYKLKTLVISKNIGGMANLAPSIENYPGFEGSGMELMRKFKEQAKNSGAEFLNKNVFSIEKNKEYQIETSGGEKVKASSIIICLGTKKRKLNIKGEEKFIGKGISYCATCDAPLFKDKIVGIVGGGNSAAMAALLLAKHSKKVYIFYRRDKLRSEKTLIERIKKNKKIEIYYNKKLKEIKGDVFVNEILLKDGEKKNIGGLFIEIGSLPITDIARKLGVKLDKEGYIHVNNNMETNIKGVFAAGDAVKSSLKQVVVAAAQGAIAAKSAFDFLGK